MRLPVLPIALGTLLLAAVLLLILNGCGGSGSTQFVAPQHVQHLEHVVVIFQENRTPDNLFHDSALISRGADIASSGVNFLGQTIVLDPITLANNYDLSHAHEAFLAMYDGGKMDGADQISISCAKGATNCPPPNPQFMYVNPSEVQPYFQMAEQYTFADRMFRAFFFALHPLCARSPFSGTVLPPCYTG
jgi:Phosphoesterase family